MYIWINQTKYELRCHQSEDIRLVYAAVGQIPVIYAPADCSVERLKQYLQWQPKRSPTPSPDIPLPLVFDRLQIFDQSFSIKLQQQQSQKLVFQRGMIYCDSDWYHNTAVHRRNELIINTVFEQSILQLVSQWEDHLQVLAGEIKFRKMTKSLYKIDRDSHKIVFNKSNARMAIKLNEWVVARALLHYCDNPKIGIQIIQQNLPDYRELEKHIVYDTGSV